MHGEFWVVAGVGAGPPASAGPPKGRPNAVTENRGAASAERTPAPVRYAAAHLWLLSLAAIALLWVVAQLLVTFRVGLGPDETVYLTQYSHQVPAALFSAPRARGVPLLVAPITLLTAAVAPIRAYLTVASGVGLFLAYWPWLRLHRSPVVPLAAFLFATTWVAAFYANEAMPDMFVAYGAVAAVALFAHAASPGRHRGALIGLGAAFAFTSLVRPTDALWVALTLIVAALLVRRWRRLSLLAAIVAGLAVGWGEWIGEAYASYGGLAARLSAAGAENETGLHFSLTQHLAALSVQNTLCRPACHGIGPFTVAWFIAVPVIGLFGMYATRHSPWFPATGLAGAAGLVTAASYVFGVGYSAPRFLLPYYALAAIPVAEGLAQLYRGSLHRRARPLTANLAALGVLTYLVIQGYGLLGVLHKQVPARAATVQAAHAITRLGMRPPCLVDAPKAPQIAYYAHCAARLVTGSFGGAHAPAPLRHAMAEGRRVVVVAHQTSLPALFLRGWPRVRLTGPGLKHWYAYLPPATRPACQSEVACAQRIRR